MRSSREGKVAETKLQDMPLTNLLEHPEDHSTRVEDREGVSRRHQFMEEHKRKLLKKQSRRRYTGGQAHVSQAFTGNLHTPTSTFTSEGALNHDGNLRQLRRNLGLNVDDEEKKIVPLDLKAPNESDIISTGYPGSSKDHSFKRRLMGPRLSRSESREVPSGFDNQHDAVLNEDGKRKQSLFGYQQYGGVYHVKTSPNSNRNLLLSEEQAISGQLDAGADTRADHHSKKPPSQKTAHSVKQTEATKPMVVRTYASEATQQLLEHPACSTKPISAEKTRPVAANKQSTGVKRPIVTSIENKGPGKQSIQSTLVNPVKEMVPSDDEKDFLKAKKLRKQRSKRKLKAAAKQKPLEEQKTIQEDKPKIQLEEKYEDEDCEKQEPLDLSDMRSFLARPTPKKHGIVQCYIERNRLGAAKKMFPEYQLFLKDDDQFLVTGKKRAKNRTSNYIISMDPNDLKRQSKSCLGKLRANFLGTEFQIFDGGLKSEKRKKHSTKGVKAHKKWSERAREIESDEGSNDSDLEAEAKKNDDNQSSSAREDLGAILYSSNILGSRGPRKMRVAIPIVKEDCSRVISKPKLKEDEVLAKFKRRELDDLMELVNKPPRWNDQVGAYVLNFNGRVTMASVKNFQLVLSEDEDRLVLQFGRVGKELFTMDYAWPLSPLQAFSICLSSFDGKIACE